MSNQRPAVAVIIPSFNGKHLLQHSLPHIWAELAPDDQLIIIEDAGDDGTIDWLKQEYSSKAKAAEITLTLIENKKNLRFAASCNKAAQEAIHPYIWLLNNDVSPHTGSLAALFEYLSQQTQPEKVFAIGCKEFESHTNQVGGKNKLWFEKGMFVHSRADEFGSGETAWVSGGSGLFSTKLWKLFEGFDTKFYPAYWEDVDLSFRARKSGYKVLFCEKAVVDHNHESTNSHIFGKQNLESTALKNSLYFMLKHATFSQKIQHCLWLPYLLLIWLRSYGIDSLYLYIRTVIQGKI